MLLLLLLLLPRGCSHLPLLLLPPVADGADCCRGKGKGHAFGGAFGGGAVGKAKR